MTEPPVHAMTQGEFRVGHVFNRAWKLFIANFWKLFVVTVISELPGRAFFLWASAQPAGGSLDGTTMRTIAMFLGFVLVFLGQAVLVQIGFQTLRGQPARLREAAQEAIARFSPILGLSLVICLLIFGTPGLFTLLPDLVEPGLFAIVFMAISGVLFIRWSVALPACVIERVDTVESLRRSAELTKGHRWKIFGIIVLVSIPLPTVSAVLGAAISFLGPAVQHLGRYVLGVAWIAGFNCVLTLIYHDLRVAKEGIGFRPIAAVFD
jgi:hypothetical protein